MARPFRLLVPLLLGLAAGCSGPPSEITGTLSYRERIALHPGCWAVVRLEDASRADAPAAVVAETEIRPAARAPVPFTLAFDRGRIREGVRYTVRGEIRGPGDQLLWTTDTSVPVLGEHGTEVDLVLVRVPHAPR